MFPHSMPMLPTNVARATGTVRESRPVKMRAKKNSFHEKINERMAVDTIAGVDCTHCFLFH